MSKSIRRGMLGFAGLVGGLGALLLQASVASAAAPVTIKLARGYGGPYQGPDKQIENASPGAEMPVVTSIEKNGSQYVIVAWMSGDVPNNLRPNQIKCSSFKMDPMTGPVLVADQVYLTQNENTDRPGNYPGLVTDGTNVLFGYGYAPNNGNTRTYTRLINEMCQSISDTVKVSNNDNENIGAFHGAAFDTGRFFVTYYSNNGNQTRGRLVTVDGTTITKGQNRGLIDPTNIGRGPIAFSNGYGLIVTGRGNQRPPEDGIYATLVDYDGNVVWKNKVIAKADPGNKIYYNQASIVALDNGRFAVMAQESNGRGKNTNEKGSNISHAYIVETTVDGLTVKGHTDSFTIYGTHSSLLTGTFGENGERVLAALESSPTDSGPAALTMLRYDSAALQFKPIDMAKDQWIASIGPSDSGKLSNMYGNNPGTQGRDYLKGIGDVKNPGFGVDGGWMSDVESFFILPYTGRVAYPPPADEPKNAAYVTFLPGKTAAPVAPTPPSEQKNPSADVNAQPPPPDAADPSVGANPDAEIPEEPGKLQKPQTAGACSVSAPGASSSGAGLAALGLALLGFAASRRRKES